MPEETVDPNADAAQQAPAKKKSRKLLIIISLFMILLLGAGGGLYYWRVRSASKAHAAREGAGQNSAGNAETKAEPGSEGDAGVTHVIELLPFIVNLADKNESRYLRMTISLGVAEEGETKTDALYTTKIRNAILATISTRTSEQILTVEGKAELRKDMLIAARGAANKPEVLTIYITDFIIQM